MPMLSVSPPPENELGRFGRIIVEQVFWGGGFTDSKF